MVDDATPTAHEDRMREREGRVRKMVEAIIGEGPLYLVDLEIKGRSGAYIVTVFVESDEALDASQLARLSRELGFALETEEVFDGKYSLNVSTPGIERPLGSPRQYRKNIGRTLRVTLAASEEGPRPPVEGTLAEVREHGIRVETHKGAQDLPFEDIEKAQVKLPW